MPRDAVKLSPVHEPPPPWWEAEWHKRQAAIRNRIVRGLRRAGRAMQPSEIRAHVSGIPKRELEYALATLLGQGTVRQFEKRNAARYGSTATRVFTYVKLTEQA
jgi:hypothetical protein